MLTLCLLRHAKSSWDDPSQEDFERPLAKRGAKAASDVGKLLCELDLKPDLVLSSAAVRTRGTVALVLPELGEPAPETVYEEDLYLAAPAAILERLRRIRGGAKRVLVVGHNPGLHALALELTASGDRKQIAHLAMRFPTAALAVLELDIAKWSEVKPATGKLAHFVTPK